MDVDSEIKKLGALGVAAALWQECGKGIIHLPRFGFAAGGAEHDMDLLLYPHARDGYATRLFFQRPLNIGQAKNWRVHAICNSTWHAPSWQGVPPDLTAMEMIAAHLRCLK